MVMRLAAILEQRSNKRTSMGDIMKSRCWAIVILAVTGISCSGRSGNDPSKGSDDGVWLRSSASLDEINKAKQLSEAQGDAESRQILEHPEKIWFVDAETESLLKQHRDTVVPKLAAIVESPGRDYGEFLQAGALLVRLGDERGREVLAAALQSREGEQVASALREISSLHSHFDDSQRSIRFLLEDSVRAQVMQLVHDYYQRGDIDHEKLESSVGWQLTSMIADHAGQESVDWLKSRLPQLKPRQRGGVYQALARLEADGWKPLLLQGLGNKETKVDASRTLGEKFRGTANAEIVNALIASLSDTDPDSTISAICAALVSVGGDAARATVRKWIEQVDPWTRMDLTWELRGLTLESVRPQLVESGLLSDGEFEAAMAEMEDAGEEEIASSKLMGLLAVSERLLMFDVETGELPCRHDKLLLDLAGISGGVFQPSFVSETWNQTHEDDYEADYTLRFVFGGRYYEGRLRNYGDWYDVERLMDAANQALADSGRHGRFVPLYSGGQVANIVFGVPSKLDELARTVALPVDDDSSRAMDEGKDFERRVLDQYRESGGIVE
jgi:hypothetical protein